MASMQLAALQGDLHALCHCDLGCPQAGCLLVTQGATPLQDFAKDDVKLFKRSLTFYEGLATRLGLAGHCLDVFACSLDQVGLAEMHPAVASTGALSRPDISRSALWR